MKRHVYMDIEQGTSEWEDVRRGMLTASVTGDLVTPTLKVAKNPGSRMIANHLVAERITGYTEPSYMSADMMRGIEDEDTVRDLYSEHYAPVTQCGFMTLTTDHGTIGYSPDGLVGDDGLIEVKSRLQKHHLATILSDTVPGEHMAQLQAALIVSGRKWLDYISFCAGMPMWVRRVTPNPAWEAAILEAARAFEEAATAMVSDYHALTEGLIPTERVDEDVDFINI